MQQPQKPLRMFLNDNETYSNLSGCIVVDEYGIAYDAERIFERIPLLILDSCRIGYAEDLLKLEADE